MLALTACTKANFNQLLATTNCPPLVTYTAQSQAFVAAELNDLPPDAETRRYINDYGTLRAVCRGE
jgi:hypothetical protein